MKQTLNFLLLGLLAITFACEKEERNTEPFAVDYELQYLDNDSIVPVKVQLINKCTGGKDFIWKYSVNSSPRETCEEWKPPVIEIDTIGVLYISLSATDVNITDYNNSYSLGRKYYVYRNNDILTYQDIKLGNIGNPDSIGCYYSTSLHKTFTPGEVKSQTIAEQIDIAFIGKEGIRFFESPDSVDKWGLAKIYGTAPTSYINYIEESNIDFNAEMFDKLTNDSLLLPLDITNDNNSFGTSVPRVILFETAGKKRGAIKVKEIVTGTNGYIIFDLKIQRYTMDTSFLNY